MTILVALVKKYGGNAKIDTHGKLLSAELQEVVVATNVLFKHPFLK